MSADPSGSPVLVVSQLPPPVHGSTIMTRTLLDVFESAGVPARIVQRRFSTEAAEVGRPSFGKLRKVPAFLRAVWQGAHGTATCIYFATNRPGSFLIDVAAIGLLRRRGVEVVCAVHTGGWRHLADRGPFWAAALRRLVAQTGCWVALGPTMQRELEGIGATRIEQIPNTVADPGPGRSPQDRQDLVFLSNLLPEKGPVAFVEACAAAAAGRDPGAFRFVLMGSSTDERHVAAVRTAVEATGSADRFDLPGHVSGEEKIAALRRARCLVFTSTYALEAQPLSVIEAMACGVPVVTYDVGGVCDLVDDGVTGYVVPIGDVRALADRLRLLLDDDGLVQRMSAAARAAFLRTHAHDVYRRAWLELTGGPIRQDGEHVR